MDLFDFKEVKYLERDTNTPTFFGKIDSEVGKGGQVMITLGDRNFFVDINPQDGSWKWTPPEALTDGEYSLSFMTIDTAGNLSTPTQRTLIVDTTPPVAPTLLNLYDDQGAITGSFDAGKMTDDRRPTLTGIAEKGTVVYLKEGNTVIGSAKADEKTGLWTLEPTVDLADGRHNLTLVAAETFADKLREGKPSDEFSIIIGKDGDVPSDPGGVAKIIEAIDNAGSLNGSLKSGGITDDTTPELRGSAPEGSVVRIQYRNDKGEWIDGGNAVMNGNSWSWTPNPALAAGNWEFRANAGSGWTDEFKLDIDLAPAAKTEITHAYDDFGPFTGMLGNGAITDDRTPNLHGRAESNSLVYIHYRNVLGAWELLDSVTAGADGHWEYETDRLSPGTYEFQASPSKTKDINKKPYTLEILAPGSDASKIKYILDDYGTQTGKIINGGNTDDRTPVLFGQGEANSLVIIEYTNGKLNHTASVTTDSTGNWSYAPNELEVGHWNFTSKTAGGQEKGFTYSINIEAADFINSSYNFNSIPSNYSFLKPTGGNSGGSYFSRGTKYDFAPQFSVKSLSGNTYLFEGSLSGFGSGYAIAIQDYARTEFITPPMKNLSFEFSGGNNGHVTIEFYDKHNNLIKKENFNTPDGKHKGSFTFPEGVVEKFIFEVHDLGGVTFDNFVWNTQISPTQSSLNDNQVNVVDDNTQDMLHSINHAEVLIQGQKDLFIDDGKTQLMVNGNQGDTVRLEDILPEGSEQNGWAEQAGTVTIAGTQYHVWSNGDAELLVQDGVKTELV
ncbi:MAG: Ig-like domain-containing protein [Pantoea dispersa]|jgi:hypothetical protein|nr:Ig-like domain-containing protein [Pantoea dispersa]MBZ6392320.1 Ig-like domain-containing protein [Pantoea dispersa]